MRRPSLHWEQARPTEALLAGAATLSVAWPLTTLLEGAAWLQPALVSIAVVALTGIAGRVLGLLSGWIGLLQLAAGAATVMWLYLGDSLQFGLPTSQTAPLVVSLLQDAGQVLQQYAAPAPVSTGVAFMVVAILTLTAIAVDTIGVSAGAPATAGIPIAATFLVSVSNNGDALQPWFFVATGGLWLLLIVQQHRLVLGSWPSQGAGAQTHQRSSRGLTASNMTGTRILIGATLVASVVIAAALPHQPPTFLADGLATNSQANNVNGGTGDLSFVDTMDPAADLRSQSDAPVVRYTTSTQDPSPLRVTSTSSFEDDVWQPPTDETSAQINYDALGAGGSLAQDWESVEVQVSENNLEVPHVAISTPLESLDPDVNYLFNPDGATLLLDESVASYTFGYLNRPDAADLPAGIGQSPGVPPGGSPDTLDVPQAAEPAIRRTTAQVIGSETSALQQALLIQDFLRSDEFTYSLDLLPEQPGISSDPISQFLANRQGYCVQFATAMVMMARSQGIPSRMAVGFLPGQVDATGQRTVIASDAHTWPELYLEGLGWTRFEPTPATRTGASTEAEVTPEATAAPQEVPSEQPAPTAAPSASTADQPEAQTTTALTETYRRALWVLLALAAIALFALVIPLISWRKRSPLQQTLDEHPHDAEAAWALLTLRLTDLGFAPAPERSPRAMREHYTNQESWPAAATPALGRLAAALETQRYAQPGATPAPESSLRSDVQQVVGDVRSTMATGSRWRSTVLPASGIPSWLRGSS